MIVVTIEVKQSRDLKFSFYTCDPMHSKILILGCGYKTLNKINNFFKQDLFKLLTI
jgi:hypothetical protein